MNEVGLEMRYFVLSPNKSDAYGAASRKAMLAYADEIEATNPLLASDLRVWLGRIESAMPERAGRVFILKPDASKPLPEWKEWLAGELVQLADHLAQQRQEGSFMVRVEHPECPFDFGVELDMVKVERTEKGG